MKRILIPVFSFFICFAVIWTWTDGFNAFTIFSYTLEEAGETPRPFPIFELIDDNGELFSIRDKQNYVVVNFMYLDCPFVCHKVNNRIEEIYDMFSPETVPDNLEFVTISFDLERDDVKKIKNYRNLFDTDIKGWTFALPYQSNTQRFTETLRDIGVWTYQIPETGAINHSIYLFLVSPDNEIIKVLDPARSDNDAIVQQINQCINQKSI